MSVGMVKVEIKVGAYVKGRLPVRVDRSTPGGVFVDQFRAEVLEIQKHPSNTYIYKVDLTSTARGTYVWVPEYRIFSFTFGGIEIMHSKYDSQKIDAEDRSILKKAGSKIATGAKP